jgi:hypothetical protein
LSVDALHVRPTLVDVTVGAARFAGAVGGVVSPVAGFVVTDSAAESADTLPAASSARTVYEYVVDAVRPVSENEVVLDVPTWMPFLRTW